ncbi:hypothetical protein E9232_006367 [Inquilinus ginsengisoli]|uniref:Lipoprotein n=1 Tax=Inquilinus ginsengisoli TaxID=363840 RepID=A0ABU1JYX2_9PROT|nr:hypothetical protein [Inquilinus ginsengisoli]MDR6293814.1 hypothetical protein [Inquilinus ginsengisoli]
MRAGILAGAAAALLLGACAQPKPVPVVAVTPPKPDLRTQTVRMTLPADAFTVGEAADYILDGSGYSLVLYCRQCPKSAPAIAAEPVSPLAFAKPNELTSAARALLLILGDGRRLIIDDTIHLVTFDLSGGRL